MSESHRCSGYRSTGVWKGYRCAAFAKHPKDGAWWCKNHLPVESDRIRVEEKSTQLQGGKK